MEAGPEVWDLALLILETKARVLHLIFSSLEVDPKCEGIMGQALEAVMVKVCKVPANKRAPVNWESLGVWLSRTYLPRTSQ